MRRVPASRSAMPQRSTRRRTTSASEIQRMAACTMAKLLLSASQTAKSSNRMLRCMRQKSNRFPKSNALSSLRWWGMAMDCSFTQGRETKMVWWQSTRVLGFATRDMVRVWLCSRMGASTLASSVVMSSMDRALTAGRKAMNTKARSKMVKWMGKGSSLIQMAINCQVCSRETCSKR